MCRAVGRVRDLAGVSALATICAKQFIIGLYPHLCSGLLRRLIGYVASPLLTLYLTSMIYRYGPNVPKC